MNRLLVAFALATLVAFPASAKPRHPHVTPSSAIGAAGAHAAVPHDSFDVIKDGRVIGRDPDPAIRTLIFKGSVPVG